MPRVRRLKARNSRLKPLVPDLVPDADDGDLLIFHGFGDRTALADQPAESHLFTAPEVA